MSFPSPLCYRALLLCVVTLVPAAPLRAQAITAATSAVSDVASAAPVLTRDDAAGSTVRATRIARPLSIDGRLDEEVYAQVQPITDLIQLEPRAGEPISERTEVWVLFDDDNIYFACRCWHGDPDRIISNEMRRDNSNQRFHDNFGVVLDTFHDRRNGYIFSITPIGGFTDATVTDERNFGPDWNTVWQNKTSRFAQGWIAEMAVPFKSLRYGSGQAQTWGINLRRNIRSKNEVAFLMPMNPAWNPSTALLRVSAGATLSGLEVPRAGKSLEVKPYAMSALRTDRVSRPAVNEVVDRDLGFDVKVGVTKSLTADFTYNTDFAQVEDDEAQVNLTRFALSFPEKREFFLEGAGIFNFGAGTTGSGDAPSLFYSRRIGLSGTRAIPVVAGARLTGKIDKWSVGVLNIESDDEASSRTPQTNFTVLRLRRDVLRRSAIGAMVSQRSVSTVATGANRMWGIDGNFAFFQNVTFDGYVARTRTEGMDGDDYAYRTQFAYVGDRYGAQVERLAVEDHFNPEIGFLRREDFRSTLGSLRFSPRPKTPSRVRQYHFETGLEYVTDTSNRLESREARGTFRTDLQNGDMFSVAYRDQYESLVEPFLIADGVRIPIGGYGFRNVVGSYTLGQQHRVSGTYTLDVGSFYSGDKTTAGARGRIELTPRMTVEPNISLNWIDLPQGGFTSTVVGTRGTFTVTPRAFVAALVQYSSSTTSLATNVRLRWEYHPGSELFVVYSEGRDTFGPVRTLENRGLAVKITHLLRF